MKTITSKEEHDEIINNSTNRVVVDYYGEFCSPCKAVAPRLDKMDEDYEDLDIYKVDAMEVQQLSLQYGVKSVPTFVVFEKGEVIDQFSGIQDVERILEGL